MKNEIESKSSKQHRAMEVVLRTLIGLIRFVTPTRTSVTYKLSKKELKFSREYAERNAYIRAAALARAKADPEAGGIGLVLDRRESTPDEIMAHRMRQPPYCYRDSADD